MERSHQFQQDRAFEFAFLHAIESSGYNIKRQTHILFFKHLSLPSFRRNFALLWRSSQKKSTHYNFVVKRLLAKLVYMILFMDIGKAFKYEDVVIMRVDYAIGFTLHRFNLTPNLGENNYSLIKNGSVQLGMTFAEVLPSTVNVFIYAEFQSILATYRNRNVSDNFAA